MSSKREVILKTTMELISEFGFHGTAVSMIAKKAEVGVGTIYRYFGSKENLITELFIEIRRDVYKDWLDGFSRDQSLWERFRTIWFNVWDYYIQHPQETIFMEQFNHSPYMNAEIRRAFAEQAEPLALFHQDGLNEGVFKDMPLEMRNTFTVGVIVSLAQKHVTGQLILDEAMQELAIKSCWDALRR